MNRLPARAEKNSASEASRQARKNIGRAKRAERSLFLLRPILVSSIFCPIIKLETCSQAAVTVLLITDKIKFSKSIEDVLIKYTYLLLYLIT